MKIKWLWDNHIAARFFRFCKTFYKFTFTYRAMDAYDENGKCVFVGYAYFKDDIEYVELLWVHQDLIDAGFLEGTEEEDA